MASWAAVEEEEQKRVEEPGTQLSVTTSDGKDTGTLLSKRRENEEHEEVRNMPTGEQKRSSQEKEPEERLKEKTTDAETDSAEEKQGQAFDDPKKFPHPRAENVFPPTTPAIVQHSNSSPAPTRLSSGTQSPPSITQLSSGVTQETAALSVTEPSHSLGTNVSSPLTNRTSENANSSLAQIEEGNSRPQPETKLEVTPTAMAARAGPTASSLPSTFRTKPQPETPKTVITDNRVAKVKKNKQLKTHKATEKKTKARKRGKKAKKAKKMEKDLMTTAPHFPYFKDHYCPPECACYGR